MSDTYIIRSYRYLRLGLVIVTLTLGVSLVIEIAAAGCYQGSISAFYYTPVHSVFIGVLFVIGVSLVALLGRDPVEDLFFNLAGFLAPVVALVPTERPGDLCGPPDRLLDVPNRLLVANNSVSLFLGFAGALVVAFLFTRGSGSPGVTTQLNRMSRINRVGLTLSAVVLVAGGVWYLRWHDLFGRRAHGAAAVAMFVAIWLAVMVNADFPLLRRPLIALYRLLRAPLPTYDNPRHDTYFRPRYRLVAAAMAGAGIVLGLAVRAGVGHAVFWLEVAEIVPFAVFWALQTAEGWHTGPTTGSPVATASVPAT